MPPPVNPEMLRGQNDHYRMMELTMGGCCRLMHHLFVVIGALVAEIRISVFLKIPTRRVVYVAGHVQLDLKVLSMNAENGQRKVFHAFFQILSRTVFFTELLKTAFDKSKFINDYLKIKSG